MKKKLNIGLYIYLNIYIWFVTVLTTKYSIRSNNLTLFFNINFFIILLLIIHTNIFNSVLKYLYKKKEKKKNFF